MDKIKNNISTTIDNFPITIPTYYYTQTIEHIKQNTKYKVIHKKTDHALGLINLIKTNNYNKSIMLTEIWIAKGVGR